jgi:hypothetical protein
MLHQDVILNQLKPSLGKAPPPWLQPLATTLQPTVGDLLSYVVCVVSFRDLVVIGHFVKGLLVTMLL